jgi:hypothetical protein
MRTMTLGCLTASVLLFGCSKPEPTVTGTIRVDGEPLARGSISFVPLDDKGAVADDRGPGGGGTIAEGKYRVEKGLTVGSYRVEIQGTRKIPGKPRRNPIIPSSLVDDEVAVVPSKYNTKSTLIVEVHAGAQTIDFPLEGIKKGN